LKYSEDRSKTNEDVHIYYFTLVPNNNKPRNISSQILIKISILPSSYLIVIISYRYRILSLTYPIRS